MHRNPLSTIEEWRNRFILVAHFLVKNANYLKCHYFSKQKRKILTQFMTFSLRKKNENANARQESLSSSSD